MRKELIHNSRFSECSEFRFSECRFSEFQSMTVIDEEEEEEEEVFYRILSYDENARECFRGAATLVAVFHLQLSLPLC